MFRKMAIDNSQQVTNFFQGLQVGVQNVSNCSQIVEENVSFHNTTTTFQNYW